MTNIQTAITQILNSDTCNYSISELEDFSEWVEEEKLNNEEPEIIIGLFEVRKNEELSNIIKEDIKSFSYNSISFVDKVLKENLRVKDVKEEDYRSFIYFLNNLYFAIELSLPALLNSSERYEIIMNDKIHKISYFHDIIDVFKVYNENLSTINKLELTDRDEFHYQLYKLIESDKLAHKINFFIKFMCKDNTNVEE